MAVYLFYTGTPTIFTSFLQKTFYTPGKSGQITLVIHLLFEPFSVCYSEVSMSGFKKILLRISLYTHRLRIDKKLSLAPGYNLIKLFQWH
jgi:hypothetical protein